MRRDDEDIVVTGRKIGGFAILALGGVRFLAVGRRGWRRAIHDGWNVEGIGMRDVVQRAWYPITVSLGILSSFLAYRYSIKE